MEAIDARTSLAAGLDGPVFEPDDDGYADEIAAFNLATTHTPRYAVGATGAADVAATVSWAGAAGLPVAVQATGHGANLAVDHGVLINTRRMNEIRIDPAARTATLGAGVTWRQLLAASLPHGLIGLHGSASGAGVVGYTLGGGLPVLGRTYGFASDYVRGLDVVTGDGQLRHADPDTEPELFWAVRGGKGNVGIVTSMTIELLPVPPLYGGAIFFAGEHVPAVVSAYREWTAELPETMCSAVNLLRLPPLPEVPEPLRGKLAAQLCVAYAGPEDEGQRLVAPMRAAAPAIMDMVGPMDYADVDRVYNDPDHPVPAIERGALLREFTSDAVGTLLARVGPDADCPLGIVQLRHMGGALVRPPAVPDAVCGREAAYACYAIGMPGAPEVAAAIPGAMDALFDAMRPHSLDCSLVNLHGTPGDAADRARPWTAEVFERLQRARASYDPAGLFAFGHAVPLPA